MLPYFGFILHYTNNDQVELVRFREVLERANYKFSTDHESVLFTEAEDEDEDDDENDLSEDATYCTRITDQADFCPHAANQEMTSDIVDDWTLDEVRQISAEGETWSLDEGGRDETQETKETVSERTEERLGCESGTQDELEEDTWIPDEDMHDPVENEFLKRGCCARADRLNFEVLGPVCGQFSDAEDEEDAGMGTSIGTPV